MAQYFTNFSEYATTVQPSDWTERFVDANNAWTVESSADAGVTGGKVLVLDKLGNSRNMLSWDAIDADANRDDVEIVFKSKLPDGERFDVRAAGRGAGAAASETCYVGGYRFQDFSFSNAEIHKYVNGVSTLNLDSPPSGWEDLPNNTWYWTRFRINGTTLQEKFWRDGTEEPTEWELSATDSSITDPGWVGLFVFTGVADGQIVDSFGVGTNGDAAPLSWFENYQLAGSGVSNDANFGLVAWTNPGNITAHDNSAASASGGATTEFLQSSAHGFAVPAGSKILGIEVRVLAKNTSGGSTSIFTAVHMVKGGTIGTATNGTDGSIELTDTYTVHTFGGPTDLWGETWSADDINSTNFGSVVAFSTTIGSMGIDVDAMGIRVHYQEQAGGAVAFAMMGL